MTENTTTANVFFPELPEDTRTVTYTLDSLEDHRVPFVKQNLGPMYLSTYLALTHFTNFLGFLLSFLLLLITLSYMLREKIQAPIS